MLRELNKQSIIDFNDYEIYEEIGKGPISMVFRAIDSITSKEVSLKIIKDNKKKIYSYLKTIITIKLLNLPGLLKIIGYQIYLPNDIIPDFIKNLFTDSYYDKNNFYLIIVEEFMKNGNLPLYINQEPNILTPTMRNKIIFGLSSTMKALHKNRILYRDLKPYFIYLDDNFEPKLSYCTLNIILNDAIEKEEKMDECVGTLPYIAPEIMNEENYSFPCDVYSFSIILYEILSNNKFTCSLSNLFKGNYPKKPENIPNCFWELIQKCWSADHNKRPSFEQITNMLEDDKFKISEETDLEELHKYQNRLTFI